MRETTPNHLVSAPEALTVKSGAPCPVSAPTLAANEALIGGSADCQRLALLQFFRATRGQDEGQPVSHQIDNTAVLGKVDVNLTPSHNLSASYNFDHSKNTNQTFDVATYGNSANGTEGPSKINVANVNLFTTLRANRQQDEPIPRRPPIGTADRRRPAHM